MPHVYQSQPSLVYSRMFSDVFHWSCMDSYARRLPANTAPAGYTCPICKSGIFPATNVASPVAETLRDSLAKVNWARAGLGLPLVSTPCFKRRLQGAVNCQHLIQLLGIMEHMHVIINHILCGTVGQTTGICNNMLLILLL